MTDFQTLYKNFCSQYNVDKQSKIIEAIKPNGHLNVSEQAISQETATILGKIFEVSNEVTQVDFENCILDEDGLIAICIGLSTNSSITNISFKGICVQNGRYSGLADMLRTNTTLKYLSLEWINLGAHLCVVCDICESLGRNNNLQMLDLRSNQLDSEAAKPLSRMISKNSTLTHLDLRFNNLGNTGAKLILEGLSQNTTLKQILVNGNNISSEFLNEIDFLISKNIKVSFTMDEYINENDVLKERIRIQEEISSKEINQLQNSLSNANSSLASALRDSQLKIEKLQESINRNNDSFKALQLKYQTAYKDLQESKGSYENILKEKNDLYFQLSTQQQTQKRLRTEISELKEICSKYEASKTEVFDLKEKIISLEAEIRASKADAEKDRNYEKQKFKENLRKQEKVFIAHIAKLRGELEEKENEMKRNTKEYELLKEELEREVKEFKGKLKSLKEIHHSEITEIKQKLKVEHLNEVRILQNQLQEVNENREETESKLRIQLSNCASLTTKNTRLQSQIHSLNNQIYSLQAEVDEKNASVQSAEEKIRKAERQLESMNDLAVEKLKLQESVEQLKSNHEKNTNELNSLVSNKEEEVKSLKNRLIEKENELLALKEDESRRVSKLHTAFLDYLHPTS